MTDDTDIEGKEHQEQQRGASVPALLSINELFRAAFVGACREKLRLGLFIACFILANIAELAGPWAIGYALEIFVSAGLTREAYEKSLLWVGAYVGLRLIYAVLHHSARYLQNTVAYRSRMYALNRIFGALLKFPLSWHVKHHSGDSLSKLHRSAGAIEQTVATYVWQIIEGLVKIIFAGVAIIALDYWVAVNVLTVSFVTIFLMVYFNKQLSEAYRSNNSFANRLNTICVDYLYHVVTVKTLGLEQAARDHLQNQEPAGLSLSKRISLFSELKWGSTTIGYALVIGFSLFIYFHDHLATNRTFEIAQVYVLLNYLDRIFQAIGSFTGYYSGIIEASIAYEDATAIFRDSDKIPTEKAPAILKPGWDYLRLENLTFSYNSSDRTGLSEVALTIRRGSKIALVGPSGHGKSTLLKVLAGLLTPEAGNLDSNNQRGLPLDDISKVAILIPQEPEIFSESLLYNLTMGDDFTRPEIDRVIELCRLQYVLAKLPNGLNTDLAQKGLNLSVGEKQRVALARGLLRAGNKDILLLDEPTSSLDPKTEKEIFISLTETFSSSTVITACHRLNLVPLFDTIIYMLNGKVEEVGSFAALIEKQGLFARAWEDYEQRIVREV